MEELKPKISILELRAKNRMSQKEFGQTVGVSSQTVSAWEKNILSISTHNLIEICKLYNVHSSDLLGT